MDLIASWEAGTRTKCGTRHGKTWCGGRGGRTASPTRQPADTFSTHPPASWVALLVPSAAPKGTLQKLPAAGTPLAWVQPQLGSTRRRGGGRHSAPVGLPEGRTEGRTDIQAPSPARGRTDTQWKAGREAWRRGRQRLSRLLPPDTVGNKAWGAGTQLNPARLKTMRKEQSPAWAGGLLTVLPAQGGLSALVHVAAPSPVPLMRTLGVLPLPAASAGNDYWWQRHQRLPGVPRKSLVLVKEKKILPKR